MRKIIAIRFLVVLLAVFLAGSFGLVQISATQPKEDSLAQLIQKLKSKDHAILLQALDGLSDYGPKAADAVPGLIDALAVDNEDVRLNAALVLGKVGKAAVPALKEAVGDTKAPVRFYAVWALGLIGPDAKDAAPQVVTALADKDKDIRRKAAYALGRIAPEPEQAIKVLIEAFKDSSADVRVTAAEAVAHFGNEAVPPLMKALDGSNVQVKEHAMEALGKIGTDAKAAVPALAELFDDPKGGLQKQAAAALAKIGAPSVDALKKSLDHPDASTRLEALATLKEIGSPAVPVLIEALDSKHVAIRRNAALMFGQMNIGDKTVVIGLGYALKDKDDLVRQYAATSLSQLGQSAWLAAPYLKKALLDPNPAVGQTALQILRNVGEDPMPSLVPGLESKDIKLRIATASLMAHTNFKVDKAMPILLDGLKQADKQLQMQSAIALSKTGQQTDKVMPVLLQGLKSESAALRQQAVIALSHIGGNDEKAIGALVQALEDPEVQVRKQAFYALQYRGNLGGKVAAGFMKLLDEDDVNFRRQVVSTLYSLGKDAVPLYLKAIKDKDTQVRQNAMWGLQSAQADPKDVVPVLAKLMHDKEKGVRQTAVQVLQYFGPAAVAPLVEALQHEDPDIRQQAVNGLMTVNGDLKSSLPQLVPLLSDKNSQVRETAYKILWKAGPDAVPHLVKGMTAKEGNVRQAAIQSLAQLKAADGKLADSLFDIAQSDKDTGVRQVAFQALATPGNKHLGKLKELLQSEKDDNVVAADISTLGNTGLAKEFVPVLIDSLKHKSPSIRSTAAQALQHAGLEAKKAVPALTEALDDENYNVRHAAFYTLRGLYPESGPALVKALSAKDVSLQTEALYTFAGFNGQQFKVKEAIPPLIQLLKDNNPNTRLLAAQALGRFGPDAKEAVPALKALLNDSNTAVRSYAQQALSQIQPK